MGFGFWENDFRDITSWDFVIPAHNLTLHAVWACTRINSVDSFVDFSRIINSGVSDFNGSTVFLDSDIIFTYELT